MDALISVIALTHNQLAYTRRCLAGILRHTEYAPWEMIVVDNGSTDGTVTWLRAFAEQAGQAGVRVSVVANRGNAGCSTARNQGIARARGAWIVCIDNDVTVCSRNWLGRLRQCLQDDTRAAMAGPKLIYPYAPYNIQCAGAGISRNGRVQFSGRGAPRTDPRFSGRRRVQCLISACLMMRRSVLEETGGFDEAFNPVEFEDFDLCYRARNRGYRLYFEPDVEMYHFESVTTAGTPSLPNTALIIRHGLLFKQRWKHMFEKENGPPDRETSWKTLPVRSLDSIPEPPTVA